MAQIYIEPVVTVHCCSALDLSWLWNGIIWYQIYSKHTYLFWARLMLHSCQMLSTTWLAILRGILPPWWLVLSTLKPSIATGNRIHFCAEWEWTRERKSQKVWVCNGCYSWNEIGLSLRHVYLTEPPQVRWEESGSLKRWRGHGLKQALDGHLNRQRCSARTP